MARSVCIQELIKILCIFLIAMFFRAPFDGHEPYLAVKGYLLKICLELATNAQRDLFAEQPVQVKI